MKALLALILMSGVYAKSLRLPAQPNAILSEDLTNTNFDNSVLVDAQQRPTQQILDENDYKNYLLDRRIYAKLQRYYLNKLRNVHAITSLEDSDIQKTVYFLIKTMRHRERRDKRSYLTLCHFKICNLGRKRTTRYFHTIKSLHDDRT